MVTIVLILYIVGIVFCLLFAVGILSALNGLAAEVTFIKLEIGKFMATAQDLVAIASTLTTEVNRVKVLVEELKANSVNPADLDPVASTLNEAVATLTTITNP